MIRATDEHTVAVLDLEQLVDHGIIAAYREADLIFLIVDGASIYPSKSTHAWLAEHP